MGHGCHDCGCPNGCTCGQPSEEEIIAARVEKDEGVIAARRVLVEAQAQLNRALYAARNNDQIDREIEETERRLQRLRARRVR